MLGQCPSEAARTDTRSRRRRIVPRAPSAKPAKKPAEGFLSAFVAPARRALERAGIDSAKKLAKHSEKEILALHGMGRASLPVMKKLLDEAGLKFKADAKPPPPKTRTKSASAMRR